MPPRIFQPRRRQRRLPALWTTLGVSLTCVPKMRSSPSLGTPSSLNTEAHARQPPIFQLFSRNAPSASAPVWAASFPFDFRVAATCPGRERALGHGEQNWPENTQRSLLGRRTSAGLPPRAWPGIVSARTQTRQEELRETVCHEANACGSSSCGCPIPVAITWGRAHDKSRLERSLASPALCFRSPILRCSVSGNRGPEATHLPSTQLPTAPSGAWDNPHNEKNLRAQNEDIPILGRPIFPKDGGARLAATRPQVCSQNAPLRRNHGLAASFLSDFRAATTCPGQERALGHGEQGGLQG